MGVPILTTEERAKALEKARFARKQRAMVCKDLQARKITVEKVLEKKYDPIIGRMKVKTLIEALPNYGKAKSEKIMKQIKIAPSRRLRGLGPKQQAALIERLM